jgi:phosphate-selective porin OprO and OprP
LNDRVGSAVGVAGGSADRLYAGAELVHQPQRPADVRLSACDVVKQISSTNVGDAGAKFDAFAMRTQVAF